MSSANHIRRVTHNVISNHRQAFYPTTNVLSSSRTKSSPSYSTSNHSFSSLVISSRKLQHISFSAKFCIFFMMLFNVTLLNQSIKIILVFDILMDLILLLLVYLRFYFDMSDRMSFYFKWHKHLFKPSFDCFLTCSIIKVTCNININNFGLHLKVFTLLTVYILLCLTNKLFVDVAYKYLISGKYLNKSYKSLSVLVHILLFTIYLTYLLVRVVLSAVLNFSSFLKSLLFNSLTSRIFIVLLFLTRTHILFNNNFLASKNFMKNYVNRHPSQLIYDTNLFDNNFNLFNMFLTNFNSSVKFAICSEIPSSEWPYHMESSLSICNINPLLHFYVAGDFSGSYYQTDCKFSFNINVDVTVDSCMNRSFNFSFPHLLKNFLAARIMKLYLLFFYVYLRSKCDMRLTCF